MVAKVLLCGLLWYPGVVARVLLGYTGWFAMVFAKVSLA